MLPWFDVNAQESAQRAVNGLHAAHALAWLWLGIAAQTMIKGCSVA